jgi:hypothetical protein
VAVVGELETRGLVERAVDPANRRRNIVTITKAGKKQLRALDKVIDQIQERVLAPLSEAERRQLTRLLRKAHGCRIAPPSTSDPRPRTTGERRPTMTALRGGNNTRR